jgi:hypothetical protein
LLNAAQAPQSTSRNVFFMRAEIETIVEEIKQSAALLRRHL